MGVPIDNHHSPVCRRQNEMALLCFLRHVALRIPEEVQGEREDEHAEKDERYSPEGRKLKSGGDEYDRQHCGDGNQLVSFACEQRYTKSRECMAGRRVASRNTLCTLTLQSRARRTQEPALMSRVSFYTLGCKLNYAETSTIERQFLDRGFQIVRFGEPADVTVVNTCSVTGEADRKCRNVIRRALRANENAFVVVTGCYAQLQPDTVAAMDGVDVVLGSNEKFRLFQLVEEFSKKPETQIAVSCIDDVHEFGPAYSASERTRAFLKVQDGCDYSCSFCTIPHARGRSRSAQIESILQQAHEIADAGYKEIVLTGVNIGLFGQDREESLLELARALDRVDGIERYRISSIEPNLLTNELIDFVAASDKFQPHFHIPLQSGDDVVLGKMRRRYRRQVYASRVHRIVTRMPHACIGVDVIVGFPAETEERFENSYRFISELPVAYLHVFTYSERPGTVAVDRLDRMGGDPVPVPERARRNRMLRILSTKKQEAFYRVHLGTERPVLWEGTIHDGMRSGYTDNYIRVEAPETYAREGDIETVRLEALSENGTVRAGDGAFMPIDLEFTRHSRAS